MPLLLLLSVIHWLLLLSVIPWLLLLPVIHWLLCCLRFGTSSRDSTSRKAPLLSSATVVVLVGVELVLGNVQDKVVLALVAVLIGVKKSTR